MSQGLDRRLIADHPEIAAEILEAYPTVELADYLAQLDVPLIVLLLKKIHATLGAEALYLLVPEKQKLVLETLSTDDLVRLLGTMSDSEKRSALLGRIPRRRERKLRLRLRAGRDTVGDLMDVDMQTLSPAMTVRQARWRLMRSRNIQQNQMYVVDDQGHLSGYIMVIELLRAPGKTDIRKIIHPVDQLLSMNTRLETIQHRDYWGNHELLPVVDRNDMFRGQLSWLTCQQHQTKVSGPEPASLMDVVYESFELYWRVLANLLVPARQHKEEEK